MGWVVSKTVRFEAAHFLPNVEEGHKCKRMHGHSYAVTVEVRGENLDLAKGWVVDTGEIGKVIRAHCPFDHQVLNNYLENPTAERLAREIWRRVRPFLPGLSQVTVEETPSTLVCFEGA